jgi:hypothetical protein
MFSSPWNTPIRKSSACMPRVQPIALRRWSRYPGGASVLRSHRPRRSAWIEAASRPWLQLHVRRLPGRNRMPGDRSLALLRARTRGQWHRRALHPNLTWGRSGQGGRIRVTSADLQYLFGIQRSEPDCMTRLVSEHDQPHIRSPRETAAPISRLRRSGLRKTRPFLKTGFLGHVRMRFVHWIRQD